MTTDTKDLKARPIEIIEQGDEDICRTLWLSVIVQSLGDALTKSNKPPFKKNRREALEWFAAEEGEGSDFATVCNLAGLDFRLTQERISQFLNHELEAIDFRCIRKCKRPTHISTKTFRKLPICTNAANINQLSLMIA